MSSPPQKKDPNIYVDLSTPAAEEAKHVKDGEALVNKAALSNILTESIKIQQENAELKLRLADDGSAMLDVMGTMEEGLTQAVERQKTLEKELEKSAAHASNMAAYIKELEAESDNDAAIINKQSSQLAQNHLDIKTMEKSIKKYRFTARVGIVGLAVSALLAGTGLTLLLM